MLLIEDTEPLLAQTEAREAIGASLQVKAEKAIGAVLTILKIGTVVQMLRIQRFVDKFRADADGVAVHNILRLVDVQ